MILPHEMIVDLFAGGARLSEADAIEMTAASLNAYGRDHRHWAIAYSGGKDSTATLTLTLDLIQRGLVQRPETLTVLYADTRMELPPLATTAAKVLARASEFPGVRCHVARAPLDKRFLVYILGRGVPPPNNNTLRWCTRQIKVEPMAAALESILPADGSTILTITGVRQGESAVRDRRIEMSCGKDGAECGQGWYQQVLPGASGIRGRIATLAPILHWRVCHVWDWLAAHGPERGWPTALLASAYGGDEAAEINARTGCIGCPLASQEPALELILSRPRWDHYAPLRRLKPLYRWMREPAQRLRKPGAERRKDGSLASNPQRMGPLTLLARATALAEVLAIQREVNEAAERLGRDGVDILDAEEEARIRELIAAGIWPDGWEGTEPVATTWLDAVFRDGTVQPLLIGEST